MKLVCILLVKFNKKLEKIPRMFKNVKKTNKTLRNKTLTNDNH